MPKYSVNEVISRGYKILNEVSPTYSMPNRGNSMNSPFQDCSSFMGVINGVGEGGHPPPTTTMLSEYSGAGYIPIKYSAAVTLQKGDVLFYDRGGGANGHTIMYIGDGNIMHMTSPKGCVRGFYLPKVGAWDWILRNPKRGITIKSWNCTSHPNESF